MNRNIAFATLFLLGTLSLGAIPAEAEAPAPGHPSTENRPTTPMPATSKDRPAPMFDALDTNHDGYVTRDEAKRSADVTARFKELDTDRDGRIAASEFTHGNM